MEAVKNVPSADRRRLNAASGAFLCLSGLTLWPERERGRAVKFGGKSEATCRAVFVRVARTKQSLCSSSAVAGHRHRVSNNRREEKMAKVVASVNRSCMQKAATKYDRASGRGTSSPVGKEFESNRRREERGSSETSVGSVRSCCCDACPLPLSGRLALAESSSVSFHLPFLQHWQRRRPARECSSPERETQSARQLAEGKKRRESRLRTDETANVQWCMVVVVDP